MVETLHVTSLQISKLKELADTVYSKKIIKLRFNDMSLIYGGPFDCNTTYSWNTPHENHREGINADISYTSAGERRISRKAFEDLVNLLNSEIDPHGHYHTTFK
jgi:hypothetical protein